MKCVIEKPSYQVAVSRMWLYITILSLMSGMSRIKNVIVVKRDSMKNHMTWKIAKRRAHSLSSYILVFPCGEKQNGHIKREDEVVEKVSLFI